MTEAAKLEVRNLKFDLGAVPRHWHGGRRAVTNFIDGLSIFFPEGERFFIESVRRFEHHVSDPALLAAVRDFIGQEGIHSREHIRYNQRLDALGYPARKMDKRVGKLLKRVRRRTYPRWRLGVTCALEHFTALMAEALLGDPRMAEGADPTMIALWRWHAAEENEHKAVAFDVYQAAGGYWGERSVVMIGTTIIFWAKVFEHQVRMMRADGNLWSAREWADLGKFLLVNPAPLYRIIPRYLAYFRPGFHPNDLDSERVLAAWRRELETSEVYADARG